MDQKRNYSRTRPTLGVPFEFLGVSIQSRVAWMKHGFDCPFSIGDTKRWWICGEANLRWPLSFSTGFIESTSGVIQWRCASKIEEIGVLEWDDVGKEKFPAFFLSHCGEVTDWFWARGFENMIEILAGILLGPTAFGYIPGFSTKIFPDSSLTVLETLANMGLIFFLFLVGLELDLRSLSK